MKPFTKQQIADWHVYERVRASGKHNMWYPSARTATGLTDKRYAFVFDNYEALQKAATPQPLPRQDGKGRVK